ncbi:hypothetical protein JW859_09525 [bacterium]|nr:hypothetical protein [bacterium]
MEKNRYQSVLSLIPFMLIMCLGCAGSQIMQPNDEFNRLLAQAAESQYSLDYSYRYSIEKTERYYDIPDHELQMFTDLIYVLNSEVSRIELQETLITEQRRVISILEFTNQELENYSITVDYREELAGHTEELAGNAGQMIAADTVRHFMFSNRDNYNLLNQKTSSVEEVLADVLMLWDKQSSALYGISASFKGYPLTSSKL